jgi:Family of unknown function (DUF6121)
MTPEEPQLPPRDWRIAPVLAAVVYAALLVAGWGFTSLVLDQDVIAESDAGPFVGPSMVCCAGVLVWATLWRLRNKRSAGVSVFQAGASVYLAMLLVGAIAYALSSGKVLLSLAFLAHYASSLFLIVPAVLASLTVLVYWQAGTRSLEHGPVDRDLPGD